MKKNIALTGMMGSGKTTIAKELGKLLPDYTLIDIDAEIERTSGEKISEIFLKHGEPYFRQLETEKIKFFTQLEHQIISLGGGALEKLENREIIFSGCNVIYLQTSPEEIFSRIKNETHRPLLAKNFSIERIQEILEKRTPNYKKANIIIDTDGKKPYNIAVEILGAIND